MIKISANKSPIKCDRYNIGDIIRIKRGEDLLDAEIISYECKLKDKVPYRYKVLVWQNDKDNWIDTEFILGIIK